MNFTLMVDRVGEEIIIALPDGSVSIQTQHRGIGAVPMIDIVSSTLDVIGELGLSGDTNFPGTSPSSLLGHVLL